MVAAHHGRVDLVKWLISMGADIHRASRSGVTALILAAASANSASGCAEQLIIANANVNVQTSDSY